jgi:hypothetical protein
MKQLEVLSFFCNNFRSRLKETLEKFLAGILSTWVPKINKKERKLKDHWCKDN